MGKMQSSYGNPANYNVTPDTRSDGAPSALEVDVNGNLKETMSTGLNATDDHVLTIPQGLSITSITTQTTTTCVTGAGRLQRIIIPTPVASATAKIYDNTAGSGTVLLDTITFPSALLNSGPIVIEHGGNFNTGCTVVTAGATMAVDILTGSQT